MEMIGQKIKELRVLQGLTQEDLAAKTNLSVRTIQRIESGEVDPRSYTLQLLADALKVDLELFTAEKTPLIKQEEARKENQKWRSLLHLSGLFVLIVPPILLWLWKKEELKEAQQDYKDIMNFQWSMLLYIIASLLLSVLVVGIILLPLIGIFSSVIVLMNTVKVSNGQEYSYPLSIRFHQ